MNIYISKFKCIYSQHDQDPTLLITVSTVRCATRSTKGILRLSSSERALITMPDDIKDILVGILLGDGHIVRRSSTSNARLVFAQTAVAHKEYFDYVFNFFIRRTFQEFFFYH